MEGFESKKSNIYVSEKLYILEKVDRDDHIYYPNDDIIFTIICINNSSETLENILIRDILPKEVVPIDEVGYIVITSKGEVKQFENVIEVRVKDILPQEAIKLTIQGKVSG